MSAAGVHHRVDDEAADLRGASLDTDLIAATIAIVATLAASLLRLGLESAIREPLSILGVSLAIVLGPRGLRFSYARTRRRSERFRRAASSPTWRDSEPVLLLIVFAGIAAVGWVSRLIGIALWPMVAVAGFGSLAILIAAAAGQHWRGRVSVVAGAVVLTAFMIGMVWQDDYNVLSRVNMMLGVDQPDTLYYASIVSMIDTYGISSTGLDGPVFVPTHFGSHALFAALASLLKVDALTILELGFPIIFLPLLVKSLLMVSSEIAAFRCRAPALRGGWLWAILIPAFVGLSKTAAVRLRSPDELALVSEPHGVGVALGLLVIALAICLWRTRMHDDRHASPGTVLTWAIVIPALIGAVAFVRLPIGAVLLAVAGYLVLRLGAYRRWFLFIGAAVGVVAVAGVALMMMRVVGVSASREPVSASLTPISWFVWLVTTVFWALVYVALRLARLRETVGGVWRLLRQRQLVDVEALAVAAAAGLAPFLAFAAPGTSMEAFLDLQRWIAIAMLVSIAGPVYWAPRAQQRSWWSRDAVPSIVVAALLLVAFGPGFVRPVIGTVKANLVTRHSVAQRITYTRGEMTRAGTWRADEGSFGRGRVLIGELSESPQPALIQQPRYALVRALSILGEMPAAQRKQSAVFIPRSNRLYWDWLRLCLSTPFAAPALSGMTALYNLPETGCNYRALGYSAYDMTDRHDAMPVDDRELCRHAVMEGVSRVAVIAAAARAGVTTRWLTCERPASP